MLDSQTVAPVSGSWAKPGELGEPCSGTLYNPHSIWAAEKTPRQEGRSDASARERGDGDMLRRGGAQWVLCAEEGFSRKTEVWLKQLGGRGTVGLASGGIAVRIESGRDWIVVGQGGKTGVGGLRGKQGS